MKIRRRLEERTWLSVGAAERDITPPLQVGLVTSTGEGRWQTFEDIRTPLLARALFLEGRSQYGSTVRLVVVSLDLLALSGKVLGGFSEFKKRIAAAADNTVTPEEIVLACTHTHSAPDTAAMLDSRCTRVFANWIERIVVQIGRAIANAARAKEPCQFAYGTALASLSGTRQRSRSARGGTRRGRATSTDITHAPAGTADESVNVASFRDAKGRLIAIVVNASCHPAYEVCSRVVSSDYPGELASLLGERYGGAVVLFLNGAAGNTKPMRTTLEPFALRRHAKELAVSVKLALEVSKTEPMPQMQISRQPFKIATRLPYGEEIGVLLTTEVVGFRLGNAAFLFLPGEPFAETGLAVREASRFDFTSIVGYAEETIGYVPTDLAFGKGGFETRFGPRSVVAPGSERHLRREALSLLDRLMPR